jgi:hypothetical protein
MRAQDIGARQQNQIARFPPRRPPAQDLAKARFLKEMLTAVVGFYALAGFAGR